MSTAQAFGFDTGQTKITPMNPEAGANIRFTDWTRADRTRRKLIAEIEAFEPHEIQTLAEFMEVQSLVIDAISLFDNEMARSIDQAHEDHLAMLRHANEPRTAAPCTTPTAKPTKPTKEKPMFDFDTAAGGSDGPWIAWSARGTQDGAIPARTFYTRDGEDKTAIDISNPGIVLDIFNMKTGWQKSDGIKGQAPEWAWNASPAQMAQRPSDDHKKGIQIKCAIGKGQVATWEQAGAAAWNAFSDLVPALQAGPGDGSLPLVRMTSTRNESYTRGSTVIPVLEVVKWVPRPDCLKEGFAAETTEAQAKPEPVKPEAPKTAPKVEASEEDKIPADAEF